MRAALLLLPLLTQTLGQSAAGTPPVDVGAEALIGELQQAGLLFTLEDCGRAGGHTRALNGSRRLAVRGAGPIVASVLTLDSLAAVGDALSLLWADVELTFFGEGEGGAGGGARLPAVTLAHGVDLARAREQLESFTKAQEGTAGGALFSFALDPFGVWRRAVERCQRPNRVPQVVAGDLAARAGGSAATGDGARFRVRKGPFVA